jgi:GNAT superfamily N-acetyltransferase
MGPGREAASGATPAPTAHAAASTPGRLVVPGSAADSAAQAASCAAHLLRAGQPLVARGPPQAGLPAGSVAAPAAGKRRGPCTETAAGGDLVVVDRKKVVKALCGVRLVWVSPKHRRRGIAKKLLEAARCDCGQCGRVDCVVCRDILRQLASCPAGCLVVGPCSLLHRGV